MRKILLTLLTTLLCSVTAWTADFTAAQIIAGANSGNVSISTSVSSITSNKKICNVSGYDVVSVNSSANANYDASSSYIEVQADDGYTISSLSIYGAANGTSVAPVAVAFWTGTASATVSSAALAGNLLSNASTGDGCGGPLVVDVPANTRTVRIYRQIKILDGEFSGSSGYTQYGTGQTLNITSISATAASSGTTYNITYVCNGAESGCPTPNPATATALPNPLPSPTKSGYVLAGWYDNEELTGDPVTAGATLEDDITLYAKWVTAYTLTWDLAGGKVTTAGTGAAVDATGTPSIALAAGASITPPGVARDYYSFNGWSPDPEDDGNEMPGDNTTYTAQWTALYATGTYTFENNASAGTAPNKLTMTDGTKVSVAAGSRVDNLFFSAQDIKYESGVYGGDGDDFKGWKINTNGATISFLVENDCDVTFGVGNLTSGATVSYTNQSGTPVNNSALTAKTDNTFSVKGGTVVTFKTSGGSTVTLKKIAITAACTSHSVTAATSTGTNTYGTVSAASASVCEGSTTTVTAVPAAGYQVTNWAVSDGDNGASISPTGASSSNTTTLTMGTADATVTVTFGCVAPTSPDITGTTAYTAGQDIELTASATGISASATYTWYKGTTWDDASATSSIHSGASLSIDDCEESDAGTYWCNISNGTGCNAHVSKAITVGPACTDPDLTITLN